MRGQSRLSCETDALPGRAVAWQKDGRPLVLPERFQALLGGQRLEIQDAQVSCLEVQAALGSPGDVTSLCARGRSGQLGGRMWGLLPPRPKEPQSKVMSSLGAGEMWKGHWIQVWLNTDPQNGFEQIRALPPACSRDQKPLRPLWLSLPGTRFPPAHPRPWCGLDAHSVHWVNIRCCS